MKIAEENKLEKQLQNIITNYANGIWNNNPELDFNVGKAMELKEYIWKWIKENVITSYGNEIKAKIDEMILRANIFKWSKYRNVVVGQVKALTELKQWMEEK